MRIVYTPRYDIGLFGLERLHPFDSRKYSRAWRELRRRFGYALRQVRVSPDRQATRDELSEVHSNAYLNRLRDPKYVARALELPFVARLPGWVIDRYVLRPMRWGTRGTAIAAREAIRHGLSVNLSGGYHHAKPEAGEGFCIYSDVALAVHSLRAEGTLLGTDRIVHIDLDAHQGNGICYQFRYDQRVFLFDMYNAGIYPAYDREARSRLDCDLPVSHQITDREYLSLLKARLPALLDSIGGTAPVRLAIYNAGTDVLKGDPLGNMNLNGATIVERDAYVIQQLRSRNIPTMMLLSGGYTRESYRLIAESVTRLLTSYTDLRPRKRRES